MISRKTAATMTQLMELVVRGGTRDSSQHPGCDRGRKDGDRGGRRQRCHQGSRLVRVLRSRSEPKVAVSVVVRSGGVGGKVAAPLARNILQARVLSSDEGSRPESYASSSRGRLARRGRHRQRFGGSGRRSGRRRASPRRSGWDNASPTFGFSSGNTDMEVSLLDAGGAALLVSQFTLYGDVRKGETFLLPRGARGPEAEPVFQTVVSTLPRPGDRGRYRRVRLDDGSLAYQRGADHHPAWTAKRLSRSRSRPRPGRKANLPVKENHRIVQSIIKALQ